MGRQKQIGVRGTQARLHTRLDPVAALLRQGPAPSRLAAPALVAGAMVLASAVPTHGAVISVIDGAVVVADDGVCALPEAFLAAETNTASGATAGECPAGDDADGGGDTLVLPSNGVFNILALEPADVFLGSDGYNALPVVSGVITVEGNGSTISRDPGSAGPFRLIEVSGGDLTLSQVTLSGGDAADEFGGALLNTNYGSLSVIGSTISGNSALKGGGVATEVESTTLVRESIVSGNTAVGDGGYVTGGGLFAFEGSTLTVIDSTIDDNIARVAGGGIYAGGAASLIVRDSIISRNMTLDTSLGGGAGIFAALTPTEIRGSRVIDNEAPQAAGVAALQAQMLISDSIIARNDATVETSTYGTGGILSLQGDLTVRNSLVDNNTSALGIGGIGVVTSTATITDTRISNNSASAAGGLGAALGASVTLVGSSVTGNTTTGLAPSDLSGGDGAGVSLSDPGTLVTIENSTIAENDAVDQGGGIRVFGGAELALTNSTISGNFAANGGAGVYVYYDSSVATMRHATIVDNQLSTAFTGAGVFNGEGGSTVVENTVISGNTNIGGLSNCQGVGGAGINFSDSDGSCVGFNVLAGDDAGLEPLAFNGGLGRTHALESGSELINAGDPGFCPSANVDQRVVPRGTSCDVGAFEVGGQPVAEWGDAPETGEWPLLYPTRAENNGAVHGSFVAPIALGGSRDGESDGQPSPTADGDDTGNTDDEDGVFFATALTPGEEATIEVSATFGGTLNAWFDWNQDGDWNDEGEHVIVNEPDIASPSTLSVDVPVDAALGTTFARFRLTAGAPANPRPYGLESSGEVEDYQVAVEQEVIEPPDQSPDTFDFLDDSVDKQQAVFSNAVGITGISGGVPVSVSGHASARFTVNGGELLTSGEIENGDVVRLRLVSAPTGGQSRSMTVNIGDASDGWTVETTFDDEPEAFDFTDRMADGGEVIWSEQIEITGVNVAVPISISGHPSAAYRINGSAPRKDLGAVNPGDRIQLRLTSSTDDEAVRSATVMIGGISDTWNVTTDVPDLSPDAFDFTDTQANGQQAVYSEFIPITGINRPVQVSIGGHGSARFTINGDNVLRTGPEMINPGDELRLRLVAGPNDGDSRAMTVMVGDVSDSWTVTTVIDSLPDAFDFPDESVNGQQAVYSEFIPITGITVPTMVSISGHPTARFTINGDSVLRNGPEMINPGDELRLRMVSSPNGGDVRSMTVGVGGVTDAWRVTTDIDATPDTFDFVDQAVEGQRTVQSNVIEVTGINVGSPISISGHATAAYRINGGAYTTIPTAVSPGDTVQLRITSTPTSGGSRSATLSIGGVSDMWTVTTP